MGIYNHGVYHVNTDLMVMPMVDIRIMGMFVFHSTIFMQLPLKKILRINNHESSPISEPQ